MSAWMGTLSEMTILGVAGWDVPSILMASDNYTSYGNGTNSTNSSSPTPLAALRRELLWSMRDLFKSDEGAIAATMVSAC